MNFYYSFENYIPISSSKRLFFFLFLFSILKNNGLLLSIFFLLEVSTPSSARKQIIISSQVVFKFLLAVSISHSQKDRSIPPLYRWSFNPFRKTSYLFTFSFSCLWENRPFTKRKKLSRSTFWRIPFVSAVFALHSFPGLLRLPSINPSSWPLP